ncbi:MAG: large conductance mechanosensitive channel [Methylobacteriaceae bacterium]|jgi:large conductance mechanosensitive channel|nr:large conductance mechanosensitive channel [Methylobacteriaceae bacterium]
MLADFRKFALRGNVIDLAIGVIIGAAFGKIVDSLVNDIIMPAVGAIAGGLDFSNYYLPLTSVIQGHPAYADAKKAGAVLGYGQFLTVAINFLIIALVLFLVVREVARLEGLAGLKKDEPALTKSEALLTEIRDLLAKR